MSATPFAIFAMVEAVAGAISMASAQSPKPTWLCHSPVLAVKNSDITGFWVRDDRVTGVMNSLPDGVMTTCTSAPRFISVRARYTALYAAMLPVMPNIIFLFFNIAFFFICYADNLSTTR